MEIRSNSASAIDTEIDFLLPGVPPTGKYVEVPTVAIVNFRGDKICHEHIYWIKRACSSRSGCSTPTVCRSPAPIRPRSCSTRRALPTR
jgi:hypothetical protein